MDSNALKTPKKTKRLNGNRKPGFRAYYVVQVLSKANGAGCSVVTMGAPPSKELKLGGQVRWPCQVMYDAFPLKHVLERRFAMKQGTKQVGETSRMSGTNVGMPPCRIIPSIIKPMPTHGAAFRHIALQMLYERLAHRRRKPPSFMSEPPT